MNKEKARKAGNAAKALCAKSEKETGIETTQTAKNLIDQLIRCGRSQANDVQTAMRDCERFARSWNVNPVFPCDALALDAFCAAVEVNVRYVGDSVKLRMNWSSTAIWPNYPA